MTSQEVFDKAARHLLTQNKKSMEYDDSGNLRCKYRGPNGLMCAVGPFIPEEEYVGSMEGGTVTDLVIGWPWLYDVKEHKDLLDGLQLIHDQSNVEEWPDLLKIFARRNHLDPTIVYIYSDDSNAVKGDEDEP